MGSPCRGLFKLRSCFRQLCVPHECNTPRVVWRRKVWCNRDGAHVCLLRLGPFAPPVENVSSESKTIDKQTILIQQDVGLRAISCCFFYGTGPAVGASIVRCHFRVQICRQEFICIFGRLLQFAAFEFKPRSDQHSHCLRSFACRLAGFELQLKLRPSDIMLTQGYISDPGIGCSDARPHTCMSLGICDQCIAPRLQIPSQGVPILVEQISGGSRTPARRSP